MPNKHSSLRTTILGRVFPAAIVSLIAVNWFVVKHVNSDISNQIQAQVNNRAEGIRLAASTKIRHSIDGCAALANNDIVVNSVVDLEHRQTTLQPFIQSLDFPGTPVHNIAMLAYDGQVIAQKLPHDERLKRLRTWLIDSEVGAPYLELTSEEFIIAQPVRYATGVEGALVVIYDSKHFFDDIVQGSQFLAVQIYYEENLLASSREFTPNGMDGSRKIPGDWFVAEFGVDNLPGLVGEVWQSDRTATRAASSVQNSMLLVMIGISGVLLLGLWLPTEFIIRQIKQLLDAIVEVRSNADLSLRVTSCKIAEFRHLQSEFNGMLADLECTTVSQETYRIPALVARYTDNLVVVTNAEGRIEWVNNAFERVSGYTLDEVAGQTPGAVLQGEKSDPIAIATMRNAVKNKEGFDVDIINYNKAGEPYRVSIESRPIRNEAGEVVNFMAIESDITLRHKAEEEKLRMASEMIDLSRQAGMAEVATGVLHNVGNVLNSVNTSASTIDERLRSPKRKQLDRVIELLDANRANLGEYLTHDDRGKHIPALLAKLAQSLGHDDDDLIEETHTLVENINHIKAIIATQQSFAGSNGLLESLDLNEVLEDALRLNAASSMKYMIQVEKELGDLPQLILDKQRLLQIVVNLVKNGIEALTERRAGYRLLTIRSFTKQDNVIVEVIDNGIGIAPEGLVKIFTHGFTTKKNGHGFGLHSCANAATEMGGQLTVESDGEGHGATFRLTLPMNVQGTGDRPLESHATEN